MSSALEEGQVNLKANPVSQDLCQLLGRLWSIASLFSRNFAKYKNESITGIHVLPILNPPSDPMDCSLPGSSIHGIFQATVLEWGAIAFSQAPLVLAIMTQQFSSHLLSFWPTRVIKLTVELKIQSDHTKGLFLPFIGYCAFVQTP